VRDPKLIKFIPASCL